MISSSLQTLSLKCLLAGLIALFSFTSVTALPLKSRVGAVSLQSTIAIELTIYFFQGVEEYDDLYTRALIHPAGNAKFPLFHGTIAKWESALKVPDLSKSHTEGDLHSKCTSTLVLPLSLGD